MKIAVSSQYGELLNQVDDLLREALEQIELRRCGVAIDSSRSVSRPKRRARFRWRYRSTGQPISFMWAANLIRVRHDGRVVLERVADVAIFVGVRPIGSIIELVWVGDVVVPLIAVVLPRNAVGVEVIADAGRRRRRNRERRVGGILVDIGILAVAEPARVVIVQQVIVTGFAMRIDAERLAGSSRSGRRRAARYPSNRYTIRRRKTGGRV